MINKSNIKKLIENYISVNPDEKMGKKALVFVDTTDNYWQRTNELGHITASAWVLDQSRKKALMVHHKKYDKWLPLGGHIEEVDQTIYDAALRELIEESTHDDFRLISDDIFDIDIHMIPATKHFPEHPHYDIRILFEGNSDSFVPQLKPTTDPVAWISFDNIEEFSDDSSVIRLIEKSDLKF